MILKQTDSCEWLIELEKETLTCVDFNIKLELEKLPPYGRLFSSSCGGLQPSAANDGALRAPPFENFFRKEFFW